MISNWFLRVAGLAGRATSSTWMAQNLKGRVPALSGVPGRIGGSDNLLRELHAVLVHLARTYPQSRLLPTDPAGEARAIAWMNWLSSNVPAMSYGQIWRANRFVTDKRDFAALQDKERSRASFHQCRRCPRDALAQTRQNRLMSSIVLAR